jgi:uncharacterized membrane protein YeaQ/YmgE (transglycosylase-associated protein family)
MGILLWIIFGGIVGLLASVLMKSDHGLIYDVVLGIVGAFIGGIIMNFLGQPGVTGFNLYSLVVAIVGAIILIVIGRAI